MKINIFIRKKILSNQNSVERFANELKKNLNLKPHIINIIKCPVASKGLIKRIYLIIWAYFNQGDVNHILGDINFISLLMNRNKTINTFLDCRLLSEFNGFKKLIYKFFWFIFPIKNSIHNTFISNFTRLEIEKVLKKKISNSSVIPVPLVKNLDFKININKKKKILIVGTLHHKNINNMIKSLINLNVDLTIVGELKEYLKDLCKKKGIKFKNYVNISDNKIKSLYKNNDILLMVSMYEGFGMPIIEAQASGMAVITSNREPMISVVGKKGLIVNPNKPKEISKMVKKLSKNKKFYLENIKYGKKNSKNFRSEIICKKYRELYMRLLLNEN